MKTQNQPKLKMSPLIKKYYQAWLVGPKLFSHPSEEKKFYQFIKSCVRYGKQSKLSKNWLRQHLERDLPNVYSDSNYIKQQIDKAVSLFDILRDFERTKFPNYSLEGKDILSY